MIVYVAGSSVEHERCAAFMRQVEQLGHTIALDWTVQVRAALAEGRKDSELSMLTRQTIAQDDADAVERCNLFVLLSPFDAPSPGCFIEFGMACVQDPFDTQRCVAVVRDVGARDSLFFGLADKFFSTAAEALEWIGSAARSS